MEKKPFLMLLALLACILTVSGAYAFGGGFGRIFEGNDEAKNALENQDYEAFIQAMSEGVRSKVAERMTGERFGQMVEQNKRREAIRQALESGNYDAWVETIESRPKIIDIITEDNFERFVELHKAIESRNYETAKAIAEELGLSKSPVKGQGRGPCAISGRMHPTRPMPVS